jgi:hypothetical protein
MFCDKANKKSIDRRKVDREEELMQEIIIFENEINTCLIKM